MAKKKVVSKKTKKSRKAPPKMGMRITKIFGWPGEVKLGKIRKMVTYP